MQKHLKRHWNICILFAAIFFVLVPFTGVQNIAFIDFPNHLTRFHILENHGNSEHLQEFYSIKDGFIPYWGFGGFMKVFAPLLGVETAGRWFAIAAILSPVIGTLLIARARHKKISIFSLAACVFIFSHVASWGFVNFLFTLGIVLTVFSFWISSDKFSPYIKIPLFGCLALTICAMHLVGAGFLGMLIGFWELYPIIKSRKITREDIVRYIQIAIVFTPAAILFLMQSSSELGGKSTFYGNIFYRKQSTLSVFNFMSDAHVSYAISSIVGIIILSIYILLRDKPRAPNVKVKNFEGTFEIDSRLFYMAVVFFGLSLIVPFSVSGVAYINIRFPIVAVLLLTASIKDLPKARPIWLTSFFIALLLTKTGWNHSKLSTADREIKELRIASQIIPRGSKVIPTQPGNDGEDKKYTTSMLPYHYTHHIAWTTIERDTLYPYFFSMFNVGINPNYTRQTVPHAFAVPYKNLDTDKTLGYAQHWREDFDYVLFMHFGVALDEPKGTTRLHQGSWFNILEIDKSYRPASQN